MVAHVHECGTIVCLSVLFCFKFNFIINWLAMHIYVKPRRAN